MKAKSKIFFVCIAMGMLLITACKKEVPYEDKNYVGLWNNSDGSSVIEIKQDGSGSYFKSGAAGYVQIKGRVEFDGNDFSIHAGFIKRKITTNKIPTKVVTSQAPYTFHYEAEFNGDDFKRD